MSKVMDEVKASRERAESSERAGRWGDAADAYEALAKAWIKASAMAMTPGERGRRKDLSDAARAKATDCRRKAVAPDVVGAAAGGSAGGGGPRVAPAPSGGGTGAASPTAAVAGEWPPGSLHAQLAGDSVGAMLIAQVEGFLTTTGVTWADIGGQEALVEDLKTILAKAVMRRPDGSVPDGAGSVLMVGPPGTGKTFLVSALANSINKAGTFFNVSFSGIEGHYKGMTEKAIGLLYETARAKAPSLVFIDEVDCLCKKRDGDSGGGAALGTLLAEMDGIKAKGSGSGDPPFVLSVAATNAPWALDAALMSRFGGHIVMVGAADAEGRKQMLEKQLRKYECEAGLLEWLSADERTAGFSGRDLSNLVANATQAMQKEMNPEIGKWETIEDVQGKVQKERPLTQADFEKALEVVKASITPEMAADYEAWIEDHSYKPGRR